MGGTSDFRVAAITTTTSTEEDNNNADIGGDDNDSNTRISGKDELSNTQNQNQNQQYLSNDTKENDCYNAVVLAGCLEIYFYIQYYKVLLNLIYV